MDMKILNLYCGCGGNRKDWTGHDITGVELDDKVANLYKKLYTNDTVIVGDAMDYLKRHYEMYDFIWASPPCQSHSRFNLSKRIKVPIDTSLHEMIAFLKSNHKGFWCVENVIPYYDLPVDRLPTHVIDRHCIWTNISIPFLIPQFPKMKGFIKTTTLAGKKKLHNFLDIHFDETIYLDGNHCPSQILRNAVHPKIGAFILEHIS
jgi:DNA (cytosine-5)-methyltransferase 1